MSQDITVEIPSPDKVERRLWRSKSGSLLTGQKLADALASKRGPCERRELKDPFSGNNEETEIETYDEFLAKVADSGRKPSEINFKDWVFQSVDFSKENPDEFLAYNFVGTWFLACVFPNGVSQNEMRNRGAVIWENPPGVPFEAFRAFMYNQDDMAKHDKTIYDHYMTQHGIKITVAQAIHDHSMTDALGDYLEGKTPVGIMGGHRTSRSSAEYRQIVFLCRALARVGFLVVTGGGPGAMEAGNLGAYLAERTDAEVEEALKIISAGNEEFQGLEYLNQQSAKNVIARFGPPKDMPSLGIPTYRYGHEPSNQFATWHAKFFSNAIREDGLLAISTGGIIYTRGGAGTRQEIFQAACHNTYTSDQSTRPMVFLGTEFWKDSGLYDMVEKYALKDKATFARDLVLTDSNEAIIDALVDHALRKGLPLHPERFAPLKSTNGGTMKSI